MRFKQRTNVDLPQPEGPIRAVAWFAGIVGRSTGYARARVWLERAIGVLFIGIGIKLAFAERP